MLLSFEETIAELSISLENVVYCVSNLSSNVLKFSIIPYSLAVPSSLPVKYIFRLMKTLPDLSECPQ
jgi:hypothetical protein